MNSIATVCNSMQQYATVFLTCVDLLLYSSGTEFEVEMYKFQKQQIEESKLRSPTGNMSIPNELTGVT